MFLLRRPTPDRIARFIVESQALPLSYGPVGLAHTGADGFTVDEGVGVVGTVVEAFPKAVAALSAWQHFALGWVQLFPEAASIAPGTVVAVAVRHLGFWSLNGCRVLYSTGDPQGQTFGFAYGTLTNHAECGEELFEVSRDPRTNVVSYRIRAVSRPRAFLARLGYPYTRVLQARFRVHSVQALRRAVERP
jgi:uncharacterized protein (UPF0548 family)